MCFGTNASKTWPIIIGVLIILVGVTELFGDTLTWLRWDNLWPYIVIAFGLIIIANNLYNR